MAPFIFHPHHPLSYQCRLPLPALYKQTKMTSESLSTPETHQDLPLSPYHPTSMLLKFRLHLWQVIRRVINCCVTELFSSNMFFFICVGKNMAMTGELKKGTMEAQERPGWEFMSGSMSLVNFDEEMKNPEMKITEMDELAKPAEMQDLSVTDSDDEEDDEEEEEDEARLSEWESDEETDDDHKEEEEVGEDNEEQPHDNDDDDDDEESEWSDDEDADSEGSAESFELWESFFNSSDPYNPLSFSSSTGSKTNTTNKNQLTVSLQIKQTESTPATKAEEHYPKPSTKEGGKKVCFSDKVTVRPLVAWSFASRAARDGSCWMQMARDRERFRRRVKSIESIIEPCLTPEHRAGIWERLQKETLS